MNYLWTKAEVESVLGADASVAFCKLYGLNDGANFVDPQGREFPLFTQNGYVHKVDVFRGAQFIHAGSPPRCDD